jgi:TRAP-type C4-dicarboxylate transport system substrate-binding protein
MANGHGIPAEQHFGLTTFAGRVAARTNGDVTVTNAFDNELKISSGEMRRAAGGAGRKLWDFLPYFTAINYAMPVSIVFVRSEAFARPARTRPRSPNGRDSNDADGS